MLPRMFLKELIYGTVQTINTSMGGKRETIPFGTAECSITPNMKFFGSCFPILDFGLNNTMLMDTDLMELLRCSTNTMVTITDLLEIITNISTNN
jgi:hypothetical protein